MTNPCEQVAKTLEAVARIVRCLGTESLIGDAVIAEVAAAIPQPVAAKSLPAPKQERKKPGRKPKADKTGPRGNGTTDAPRGIKSAATGPVRPRIVDYLRRVGTADVPMIVEGTGLEKLQVKQALAYGMSQGAFVTPKLGFWQVDADYEG